MSTMTFPHAKKLLDMADYLKRQNEDVIKDIYNKKPPQVLEIMSEMNAHFKSKQTPQRFTYLLVDNTMVISRRYPVAIFLIHEKKLYRIYGSLHLQWNMVKGAIKKFVKDITIIE